MDVVVIIVLLCFIGLWVHWANKSNTEDLAAPEDKGDMFAKAAAAIKAEAEARKIKAEWEAGKAKAKEKALIAEAKEVAKIAKAEEEARIAKTEEEARKAIAQAQAKAQADGFAAARKAFLLWAIDVDLKRLNKIAFIVSEIEGFDIYSKSKGVSQLTIEQMIEIQKSYPAGSHVEIKPPALQIRPTESSTNQSQNFEREDQNLDDFDAGPSKKEHRTSHIKWSRTDDDLPHEISSHIGTNEGMGHEITGKEQWVIVTVRGNKRSKSLDVDEQFTFAMSPVVADPSLQLFSIEDVVDFIEEQSNVLGDTIVSMLHYDKGQKQSDGIKDLLMSYSTDNLSFNADQGGEAYADLFNRMGFANMDPDDFISDIWLPHVSENYPD